MPLVRHPSARLLLEITPDHLAEAGTRLAEVRDFLVELGFSPFLLTRRGMVRPESWETVEAVARRNGYIDVLFSRSVPSELIHRTST